MKTASGGSFIHSVDLAIAFLIYAPESLVIHSSSSGASCPITFPGNIARRQTHLPARSLIGPVSLAHPIKNLTMWDVRMFAHCQDFDACHYQDLVGHVFSRPILDGIPGPGT